MTVDGDVYSFRIPDDLTTWRPSGTSRLSIDFGLCNIPYSVDVVIRLEDAAGNTSSAATSTYTPINSGYRMDSSRSDDLGDKTGLDIGSISGTATVCGNLYSVSSWTGDIDYVIFTAASSATHVVQLSWTESGADYDIWLVDMSTGLEVDSSLVSSTGGPETIRTALVGGTEYFVQIAGWSGNPGDWTLTVR